MARLAAALLAACLASGCFVVEEIDKGQKYMDQHADVDKRKAVEEEKAAAEQAKKSDEGPGVTDRMRGWWEERQDDQARAADSGPGAHPDDKPGRCELNGSTQFMRKFDCQLRGGTYTPLS